MPSTLVISRADETDIDGILGLIYSAFKGNDLREAFFGHDTPESRASAKERIAASMRTGQQNVWLKVVEQETGRMVSGSWWMVYPNLDSSEKLSESAAAKRNVDYLFGEDKVKGELFVRDWMTRRARYMYGHAHILLVLLFTDPTHQQRGAGSLQVEWGVTLADQLFLPWYVEGTPAGHHLYSKYGARDLEKVRFEAKSAKEPSGRVWISEYTMMRRDPSRILLRTQARSSSNDQ